MRHLPQALAARGHEVHFVQAYSQRDHWEEQGVAYHFVPNNIWERRLSKVVTAFRRHSPTAGDLVMGAARFIGHLKPEIVHYHGLTSSVNLFWLLRLLGDHGPPVIGHYHGGLPAENRAIFFIQKQNLARLNRALFTTREHARPFLEENLLRPDQIIELMEGSTSFQRQPQAAAREKSRIEGSPVFLWTARLAAIKDPLVALRGFEIIARQWLRARLVLYYLDDTLLPQMKAFLADRPSLARRIHFRGPAPHHDMEMIYSSADFFLQASRREFSGYAVLEAMACGAIPVVTDIPSFRTMTDGGRCGILFPVGDHQSLAHQVLSLDLDRLSRLSRDVQNHFQKHFGFPVMAEKLEGIYKDAR